MFISSCRAVGFTSLGQGLDRVKKSAIDRVKKSATLPWHVREREREHIRGMGLHPQWDARTKVLGESVDKVPKSWGYFSFSIASFLLNYTQMYCFMLCLLLLTYVTPL